jgi:hypothetical protein
VDKARVIRDLDGTVCEIWLAPIRSSISYATALHEFGHILGRHQKSRNELVRERWAWEWARRSALYWTPAMERHASKALAWCASRQGRVPTRDRCGTVAVGPSPRRKEVAAQQREIRDLSARYRELRNARKEPAR